VGDGLGDGRADELAVVPVGATSLLPDEQPASNSAGTASTLNSRARRIASSW
jgi:hypothetical protein